MLKRSSLLRGRMIVWILRGRSGFWIVMLRRSVVGCCLCVSSVFGFLCRRARCL